MTLLTDAKTAAAGGDTSYAATGAAFMWDAAYATFNGVSGGKSVGDISWGVCAKRDNDFADGVQVRKMILKQFQAGKWRLLRPRSTRRLWTQRLLRFSALLG